VGNGKASEASKKRKAIADNAVKESANYDWDDLADNGKVKLEVYLLSLFLVVCSDLEKKNPHCFNHVFACEVVRIEIRICCA